MLANQRREKILELLMEDGSAKVNVLAKIFKVTEVTTRQDLEKLEKDRFCQDWEKRLDQFGSIVPDRLYHYRRWY